MKILIVGGGLAGLTLAVALKGSAHEIELVERTGSWTAAGSGIGIGPNAMFALRAIGVGSDSIAAAGFPFDQWEIYGSHDLLHRYDFSAAAAHFGSKAVAIHRAALQAILLDAAAGTRIRLGTSPIAISPERGSVHVALSDGSEDRFDLVVGADGLNSSVRSLVFGEIPVTYSGHTSFRCVVQRSPGLDCLVEIWDDRKRVGMAPINDHQSYCYATLAAPPCRSIDAGEGFDLFKREFRNLGGHFPHIYKYVTRPDQLIRTDLTEVVNRHWAREHVILIGDAAHAMTPELGQGGAMAIEDAVLLANHLRQNRTCEQALEATIEERRPIVTSVQTRSRLFGVLVHLGGPHGVAAARDALVREHGGAMMNSLVFGH
jgi:2-polyprenyl-6-methoxyphenol hydroxylase-like FAD-dependent oxidoreductase